MPVDYDYLLNLIKPIDGHHWLGTVSAIQGDNLLISGLCDVASIGDHLEVLLDSGAQTRAEVVKISDNLVTALPFSSLRGVQIGCSVRLEGTTALKPSDYWLGRILDPLGQPMDGKPVPLPGNRLDCLQSPPAAARRRGLGERIRTNLAVLNTFLPLAKGQRVGLFAGSGVGKSKLLASVAAGMAADIVVVAMIGERGREISEFAAQVLGPETVRKTVIIAASSDQPASLRRQCAWTAMTVAEYFRDQGKSVLLLADSITRFAEAHREIATASGELPAMRGFPPSVVPTIAALCERAGPGVEDTGDITAIFSVLVAGSDMDEPIADILRGILDGHIVLEREIAERGRYPAINLLKSVSRSLPGVANDFENSLLIEMRRLLGTYETSKVMVNAGLYTAGTDPDLDRAIRLYTEIENFLTLHQEKEIEDSFEKLSLIARNSSARG